jgi:hypothetical protein
LPYFSKENSMKLRHVAKTVGITAAVTCAGGLSAIAIAGTAGADLTTGQQVQAAVPQNPFSPGIPFASGQTITVSLPPETILPHGQNLHIVECQAGPGGTVPTGTFVCDQGSQYAGNAVVAADGSLSVTDFSVFAIPSPALGENASNPTQCGTAANECILYIGADQTQPSLPHVWSQGFQVAIKDAGETGTVSPGDGTPEVPLAVGLPLAAAGLFGGTVLVRRRRAAKAA